MRELYMPEKENQNAAAPLTTLLRHGGGGTDKIIYALLKAKAQFPVIFQAKRNDFTKSKYADLAQIEKQVGPILIQNGLFCLQPWRTTQEQENSNNVSIEIEIILFHESGQFISTKTIIPFMAQKAGNNKTTQIDAHGLAGAITYFRRYQLMSFFGLVTDDDDGNAANAAMGQRQYQQQPPAQYAPPPEPMPTAIQIQELKANLIKCPQKFQESVNTWLRTKLNINSIDKINCRALEIIKERISVKMGAITEKQYHEVLQAMSQLNLSEKRVVDFINEKQSLNLKALEDLPLDYLEWLLVELEEIAESEQEAEQGK